MMLSSINAELNDYNERSGCDSNLDSSATNSDYKLSFNSDINSRVPKSETEYFREKTPIESTSNSVSAFDEKNLTKQSTNITKE